MFEWLYGGRFLRDRHVVRGAAERIVYWYIALPGFHSEGHVETGDSALAFRDNLMASAARRELRSTWRRSGTDGYTVRTEEVTGGRSKELWSMEMKRSRPAPAQ